MQPKYYRELNSKKLINTIHPVGEEMSFKEFAKLFLVSVLVVEALLVYGNLFLGHN